MHPMLSVKAVEISAEILARGAVSAGHIPLYRDYDVFGALAFRFSSTLYPPPPCVHHRGPRWEAGYSR